MNKEAPEPTARTQGEWSKISDTILKILIERELFAASNRIPFYDQLAHAGRKRWPDEEPKMQLLRINEIILGAWSDLNHKPRINTTDIAEAFQILKRRFPKQQASFAPRPPLN